MPLRAAPTWSFLTNHARVLLCVVEDPTVRLREIGERVGVTERAAHRIVNELVSAGYVSRHRDGRRNHYTVHRDLPLPDQISRTKAIGELLAVLVPADDVPIAGRLERDGTLAAGRGEPAATTAPEHREGVSRTALRQPDR